MMDKLIIELKKVQERLSYLKKKYPIYKNFRLNPIPEEIKKEYNYLYSRERNLKININQDKQKGKR